MSDPLVRRWLVHPRMRGLHVDDPRYRLAGGQVIRDKVFLRRIYDEWYAAITATLPPGPGPVVELGSGGGFMADRIPGLITSDLCPSPGVRILADGQALPVQDGGLRAIVMTDVLHHLPESRRFLREAARCVRPGGRVIMIEPWVSAWSSFVYSRMHHEPFLPHALEWEFPAAGPLSGANMALPWMIFVRDRRRFERDFPEWRVIHLEPFMPFRYLVSGGVSLRRLTPDWSFAAWRRLEKMLEPWMAHLGMFVHVVLERAGERASV